ncbi:MAG: SprT-like domain-containing protein [Planctomycetota bacterium]
MISPVALDRERREAFASVSRVLGVPELPQVPVRWNRRLRRAGRALIDTRAGRFEGACVELSPAYFEVYPQDLRGILVHEAVHVGLAVLGKSCGHGPEFRSACLAAGGRLHSRWLPGRVYRYRCPVCGEEHVRRRRAAGARWCAPCTEAAPDQGRDPFAADRALKLVGTAWVGPEEAANRDDDVCEAEGDEASLDLDAAPTPRA